MAFYARVKQMRSSCMLTEMKTYRITVANVAVTKRLTNSTRNASTKYFASFWPKILPTLYPICSLNMHVGRPSAKWCIPSFSVHVSDDKMNVISIPSCARLIFHIKRKKSLMTLTIQRAIASRYLILFILYKKSMFSVYACGLRLWLQCRM